VGVLVLWIELQQLMLELLKLSLITPAIHQKESKGDQRQKEAHEDAHPDW